LYYNILTMTIMVILTYCSSLKEKQDDRYDPIRAKYDQRARHVHTVSAPSTCSHDVWNTDMELVRTRFHGSMIFQRNEPAKPAKIWLAPAFTFFCAFF
jgi:hypothetical protein